MVIRTVRVNEGKDSDTKSEASKSSEKTNGGRESQGSDTSRKTNCGGGEQSQGSQVINKNN